MNQEEIKKILPHRDHMLLIDEAELREGKAYGKKTIRGDEFFLQGHFPGNPVVPGVILCEILGQSACVLLSGEAEGITPFFTGLDKVRFKNPVHPGDVFETECTLLKHKGPFYWAEGKGYVDGKLCVSAEFSVALIKEGQEMCSKILVANRGEVAVRIIRACKEMGIETVAVYSEADRNSLPVALADERICIGGNAAAESYLNQKNIISAALATNSEAIHPGYGFLSENAGFAKLCEENGIVFIGPKSEVISAMGDKDTSRQLMQQVGVPVVPGTEVLKDVEEAKKYAKEIGYPLLVKATAGGGGKGIRVVAREEDLADAFHTASREAESAFGNGDVFLEKYLTHVRHVEMQILADQQGNILCLGERDCSLQLNKQKVLEETPSPVMTEDIRRKMMDAAVLAAKAANYTNAGTVEFLLAPDGQFYFIEMNTRLQVEHPITEEISGVDIVKWQIRIACQVPLNMKQEDIRLQGHAIECRINARSTGRVEFLHIPGGGRVHFDTALMQDTVVVPFYDSMLGKLIVHANTREEAIRRMEASLCEMVIVGVETNIEEQLQLIRSKIFQKGNYDTLILDKILKKG